MLTKQYNILLPQPAIASCTASSLDATGNSTGDKSCIRLAPAVCCPYIICHVTYLRDEWCDKVIASFAKNWSYLPGSICEQPINTLVVWSLSSMQREAPKCLSRSLVVLRIKMGSLERALEAKER